MRRRPKGYPDAELAMADLYGVQIASSNPVASHVYCNYDFLVPMDAFSHSETDHYVTCILLGLNQVRVS